MYELALTITAFIIFLTGWNCANMYSEYEAKKKEEYKMIVERYCCSGINE